MYYIDLFFVDLTGNDPKKAKTRGQASADIIKR